VKELAKKKGVALSDTPKDPEMRKHMESAKDELSKLKGPDFDRAFANRMSMGHKRVISMAKAWRQDCKDQDVCSLIDTLLPQPEKTRAAKKTLRILQWNHFVPNYDKWFNGQYVKEWGEQNDTQVIVDNVGIPAINPTAAAEVSAKKGHDLFTFLWPRPAYEED